MSLKRLGPGWKELFASFWQNPSVEAAQEFFNFWYRRVIRSRIPQFKVVAKMLRSHLERLINYILHPITNAVTEGFNSKIQALRQAARGFRSFANYLSVSNSVAESSHCYPNQKSHAKPGRTSSKQ